MFGNLISNRQLRHLLSQHALVIDPFDENLLKATHYTLLPGRVLRRKADGKWSSAHSFAEDETFVLQPDEYIVVEVKQRIRIHSEGLVGRFITTSNHIEGGLLVTAGQIDHKYGTKGELLRFGMKNLLSMPNELRKDTRLAHVEFFDLRGITIDPRELSPGERKTWDARRMRADKDGVFYEDV